MMENKKFDVIIIGGSYSGLSAGMALGRAMLKTLIIDNEKPCNIQTPYSHNFITQDGKTPTEISTLAKQQVKMYNAIKFYDGLAISATKVEKGFEIKTEKGDMFIAKKIIVATGVKDIMPTINGFANCWGISIIHCPYCHGYEYSNEKTGILANGEIAFQMGKLINNWTKDLTIFTNGKCTLTNEQVTKLSKQNIKIDETQIDYFKHNKGQVESIVFKNGSTKTITAVYARPDFEQHCTIPQQLNCEITEQNHIKVDAFQKTTIDGVFACGDNSSMMRSVSHSVAMGGIAGAMASRELFEENFN